MEENYDEGVDDMREILFKAKRLDNGEWVEGFYMNLGNKYHYILAGKLDITRGYPDFVKYSVAPETICQYTGLTDKNGNKIWENDIVKKYGTKALGRMRVRNYKVSFGEFGGWLLISEYGYGYWIRSLEVGQLEAIGNIFDNPELLKVGTT